MAKKASKKTEAQRLKEVETAIECHDNAIFAFKEWIDVVDTCRADRIKSIESDMKAAKRDDDLFASTLNDHSERMKVLEREDADLHAELQDHRGSISDLYGKLKDQRADHDLLMELKGRLDMIAPKQEWRIEGDCAIGSSNPWAEAPKKTMRQKIAESFRNSGVEAALFLALIIGILVGLAIPQ